jgi:hypothetical protein
MSCTVGTRQVVHKSHKHRARVPDAEPCVGRLPAQGQYV